MNEIVRLLLVGLIATREELGRVEDAAWELTESISQAVRSWGRRRSTDGLETPQGSPKRNLNAGLKPPQAPAKGPTVSKTLQRVSTHEVTMRTLSSR